MNIIGAMIKTQWAKMIRFFKKLLRGFRHSPREDHAAPDGPAADLDARSLPGHTGERGLRRHIHVTTRAAKRNKGIFHIISIQPPAMRKEARRKRQVSAYKANKHPRAWWR